MPDNSSPTAPPSVNLAGLLGYNIMLVEDSDADAMLIDRRLKSLWPHCTVYVVRSLADAYETYIEKTLDIILLDLNLPDGFGARSLEEALSFVRKVPVVVITGMATQMTIDEVNRMGGHKLIAKSRINEPEFEEIITRSIRDRTT